MSIFGKFANKILPSVNDEAERELDRVMAQKCAEEEKKVGIFVSPEMYDRVQMVCEQEGITESQLISEALDAFESD